jgi:hypothetical protein
MESTRLARDAMIVLGANGIEERFSPLPRLYRDALIMEIWEGPHDLLFTQAMRDLTRFDVDGGEFIARVSGEEEPSAAESRNASGAPTLSVELAQILSAVRKGGEDDLINRATVNHLTQPISRHKQRGSEGIGTTLGWGIYREDVAFDDDLTRIAH